MIAKLFDRSFVVRSLKTLRVRLVTLARRLALKPIRSTTFLVPTGTAAPCRRRQPTVLLARTQAASGMFAIAHRSNRAATGPSPVKVAARLCLVVWCPKGLRK